MRPINRRIPDPTAKQENVPKTITAAQIFGVPVKFRFPAVPAILGNERGVALVMALVLGLVGMLIISALIYMVGTGTWVSGSKKRYQVALEASHGGLNFFAKEIIQQGVGGTSLSAMGTYGGTFAPVNTDANFNTKLTTIGMYPAAPVDATLTLVFTPPTPDMAVSGTILATNPGNSSLSPHNLVGGGVVAPSSGGGSGQAIPYLFQVDIQGQQSGLITRERARLSAIYAY